MTKLENLFNDIKNEVRHNKAIGNGSRFGMITYNRAIESLEKQFEKLSNNKRIKIPFIHLSTKEEELKEIKRVLNRMISEKQDFQEIKKECNKILKA